MQEISERGRESVGAEAAFTGVTMNTKLKKLAGLISLVAGKLAVPVALAVLTAAVVFGTS